MRKRYWKKYKPDGIYEGEPYWIGPANNKIYDFKEWLKQDTEFWKEWNTPHEPHDYSPNPRNAFAYDENGKIYSKSLRQLQEQTEKK